MSLKYLLSEYQLGAIKLSNRIVMAPMTRSRALKNIPNDMMAEYYRQRASAGLIIAEGAPPSPNGSGYPRIPGIYNREQIEGWKKVTKAVHQRDGRIFLQLMHTGRVGHRLNLPEGGELVAPSAIPVSGRVFTEKGLKEMSLPRMLETQEVRDVIKEFVQAAGNSIEAGFDGIELHGANGYIIDQFLNPKINQRNDEFGGSIENRSRFVLEIVRETANAIGKDKVGIRLSPYGTNNEMTPYPPEEIENTFKYLAEKLNEIGIVYIHLTHLEEETFHNFRTHFDNTLIYCGDLTAQSAENLLKKGKVDLTAFGKPFLANPDLVERFRKDAKLNKPDPSTFYTSGNKGYTDYPQMRV